MAFSTVYEQDGPPLVATHCCLWQQVKINSSESKQLETALMRDNSEMLMNEKKINGLCDESNTTFTHS